MLLLEDHIINNPCEECMTKHMFTIKALAEEGLQLGGDDTFREIQSLDGFTTPEKDLQEIRGLRKKLMESMGIKHTHKLLHEAEAEHDHLTPPNNKNRHIIIS
jgi:hypothetical protein